MKDFMNNGGSLLAMLGEGGEQNIKTNLNFLLEEYGIMVNSGIFIQVEVCILYYFLL